MLWHRESKAMLALLNLLSGLIGLSLGSAAGRAQGFYSATPTVQPSQTQVAALLDDLEGIRAEYQADIGLNVLEYNWDKLAPAKRRGALTAIFEDAPQMLFKAQEIYAVNQPMSLAANDAGLLSQMNIDTLDVEVRAVRLLLRDAPQDGSDFFSQIALPARRATCDDALVYDLGSYYETLALLLSDSRIQTIGGTPKALFTLTVIRAATDLERIAPLVSVMGTLKLGDDDLRTAIGYLTQNIRLAESSDREEIALSGTLIAGISDLVKRMRATQIPTSQLINALRTSLIANLSKSYCSDQSARRDVVAFSFNALLLPAIPDSPKIIAPTDLRAVTTAGKAADPLIAEDLSAVGPAFRRIVAASEARQATNNDPATAGIIEPDSSDVSSLLEFALSPVDANSDCRLCQLVAHGEMFGNLHNFLPAGHSFESWINGEVDFLTSSPLEEEDPPTYMMILKTLVLFSRPVSANSQRVLAAQVAKGVLPQYTVDEPGFVHRQLRSSADPVIQAYMKYEDLFCPAFIPIESKMQ